MDDLLEPGPDDVIAAAEASHDLLSPLADMDWSVIAGDLEWDCRQTLEHVAFVQLFYATSAADPSQRRLPTARINNSDRSIGELVNVHLALSNVLAAVLRSMSEDARSIHPRGSPTATVSPRWPARRPWCTRGNIARGLGVDFMPPAYIAAKSLARLFPWVQDDGDPWQTLLYAAGRRDLGGNDRRAPNWSWQCAPLSEWKGDIRVRAG